MTKKFLGLMLLGMSISTAVFAQPGTLDDSFNGKGIKEISFHQNISSDSVVATVLQPDGKLLVALVDNAGAGNLPTANAVVIRLKSNGERDLSFGTGGKVNVSHTVKSNFHHNAMALQEDGKIILAGHTNNLAKPSNLCLVRLNADGSKDDTFGETAGLKKTGYRGYAINQGYTFKTVQVLNTTGTVLAAASTESNTASSNFLFTATDQYGAVISNYGGSTNGIVSFDYGAPSTTYDDIVRTSALDQSSGVWYIAGTTRIGGTTGIRFAMIALDAASGTFKTDYQSNGKCIYAYEPGTNGNDCKAICFTPDNTGIILAGSPDFSSAKMMVYKLDKKCKPDSSFSSDGREIYTIPGTSQCNALSVVAETGNKVLLGGYALIGGVGAVPAYVKINSATGETISAFGNNGTKTFTDKTTDGISSLVYLPGLGKFISAGSYSIQGNTDVVVKRIEANGSADNSYGNASEVICAAEDGATSITDVLPRSDGKIWICGNISIYGGIALVNKDGSFDASFSNTLGNDPGVQYISSFLPLPPLNTNPLPGAQAYALAETSDGKLLVAGTYQTNASTDVTMFVLKLKNNNGTWIRDTDFGTDGYATIPLAAGYDYAHDMIVQPDGKILLYGYVYYNSTYYAAVTRLSAAGAVDAAGFANTSPYKGTYMIPSTTSGDPSSSPLHLTFALQDDGKIVCTAPGKNAVGAPVFLAHRISANGTPDAVFNANASNALTLANAEAETILLKKDGSIVLGGTQDVSSAKNYALAQLKTDGKIDTDFNNTGFLSFSKGYEPEVILDLNEQSDGSIVATATASIIEGNFLVMDIRVTAKGALDKTFYGEGLIPIAKGFPEASLLLDGSLYIFGERNATEETAVGIMMKVKLGTGPTVKTTHLVLANLTVQYGDKPFKLQPITNSPAKIYYSIVQGDCAKVNPLTTEVTVTCATVDSGEDIIIRAFQAPTTGYTTDTAYCIIKVIKATPRILFTNEGGELGDTITVSAISSSGVAPVFTQLDGAAYVQFLTANTAKLIGEGSSTVSATFAATQNYEQATVTALISGYTESIAPDANEDDAELVFGTEVNISIDVLGNDEAYTGVIVPQLTDLDPSTVAVDSFFVSPSLGLFELDTTGVVTYTPFSGFIGSGDITYTIRDSKGVKSAPGIIHVAVVPQANVPALKATEMVTPNNDGLNEAFVIGFVNLEKENQLKVFDRNGQELFTKDNYKNDWNGILPNGKPVENGIYYYVFVEGMADDQRELKGAVEIRR
jgi:uncharacterized delta-60 repeat protein/gliding motility-associated-like protein